MHKRARRCQRSTERAIRVKLFQGREDSHVRKDRYVNGLRRVTDKTAAERSLISSAKDPKDFVVAASLNRSTKEVNRLREHPRFYRRSSYLPIITLYAEKQKMNLLADLKKLSTSPLFREIRTLLRIQNY